jgi:hypothetical protein
VWAAEPPCGIANARYTERVHLEPAARPPRRWPPRTIAGLVCFALGVVSVSVAAALALRQNSLFDHLPDWRVTVPLWAAAAIAAAVSGVRREGSYGLAVAGVALASAALALGWVLLLAMVASVMLVIIYVMSEVF